MILLAQAIKRTEARLAWCKKYRYFQELKEESRILSKLKDRYEAKRRQY